MWLRMLVVRWRFRRLYRAEENFLPYNALWLDPQGTLNRAHFSPGTGKAAMIDCCVLSIPAMNVSIRLPM